MRLSFWLLLFMFSSSHAQVSKLIGKENQLFNLGTGSEKLIFDANTASSPNLQITIETSSARKYFVQTLNSHTLNLDVTSLYETDKATNQNQITNDGEKLRTTLCSSLEGMLSNGEGASAFGLKSSVTGLSNYINLNLGEGISTSLLLPQVVKVAQRVENEYRNKHCANQPINCFRDDGLDGRPIDSGYFRDLCEDAFTYQFEPSGQPIDTIISANNLKSIE
ncbi:MAG: hypothetical protein KC478_05915, partial [Bacteriovoracaceae bacterium]|nr:hypothetical protein [Bacteriovoracaceae bacterium]